MTDDTLLSVRNLRVAFPQRRGGEVVPVDDVSFDLKRGEILGFVGESGAGKSMTAAAIIGLIEPPGRISGGEIWFNGKRIDQDQESLRGRHIGAVFQDPLTSLNPLKRIGDQLTETIRQHLPVSAAEAKDRAARALEEVGLSPDRLNAYPHEFSGGMRQRVVIALALAAEPSLIIADEPTTALDVSVQAQVLDLLKKLCREKGAAVILVTHDMGVISETTDRVAVMYAGRLVETGPTREVITNAQHPYARGLIASTPAIDATALTRELYQIPGSMPRLDNVPDGCAFHPRCTHAMPRCAQQRPDVLNGRAACWLLEEEAAA